MLERTLDRTSYISTLEMIYPENRFVLLEIHDKKDITDNKYIRLLNNLHLTRLNVDNDT